MSLHTTQVASRIASNVEVSGTDRPHHAAKAQLFAAQAFEYDNSGTSLRVEPDDLDDSYKWLASKGVKFVNESVSFDRRGQTDNRDMLADWRARYDTMLFLKAAGNQGDSVGGSHATYSAHADCTSYNDVCVGDGGWTSTPLDTANWGGVAAGRVQNPYSFAGSERREQEKPDVISESIFPNVALLSGTTDWSIARDGNSPIGTSFSAPVVAGLAVLLEEQCVDTTGNGRHPLWYRSIFRTQGTWQTTTTDQASCRGAASPVVSPVYPAPHLDDQVSNSDCDYIAGAGPLFADHLTNEKSCDPPPPGSGGGGGGPSTWFVGGEITPGGVVVDGEGPVNWTSVPEDDTDEEGQRGYSTNALRATSSWKMAAVYRLENVPGGARIRSTLSYSACAQVTNHNVGTAGAVSPSSASDPDWFEPAVNLDWGLRGLPQGESSEKWVFVAESFDDTNEGFDVTLPLAEDFEYLDFYLLRPPDAEWADCLDRNNANIGKKEPWGAWVAWQSGS